MINFIFMITLKHKKYLIMSLGSMVFLYFVLLQYQKEVLTCNEFFQKPDKLLRKYAKLSFRLKLYFYYSLGT